MAYEEGAGFVYADGRGRGESGAGRNECHSSVTVASRTGQNRDIQLDRTYLAGGFAREMSEIPPTRLAISILAWKSVNP